MELLDDTLERWRRESAISHYSKQRDKGTAFERLCQAFLTHDSVWSQTLEPPVFWSEWAAERDGFDAKDTGVDLVAKLRNEDGWCAIQCKFRNQGGTVSKGEIDSFISASGSAEFTSRILIDTTGRSLGSNAESAMRRQDRPVTRIGLSDLRQSRIRWELYLSDGEVQCRQPKRLLPHQQAALAVVAKGLAETGTRGKMIMACGTGKTLTALRIAEHLAGPGRRVLYLVPSLSLMSQTVQEWTDNAEIPLRCFAVCSDSQVGKRRTRQDDRIDMDSIDLALPATTDAAKIATSARRRVPNAMTVVFATYQSTPVIERAQSLQGKCLQRFDLAICDEAHRTTGGHMPGEEDPSHFLAVHDNGRIRATRRLYMTATAKIYGQAARSRAKAVSAVLCSMDDEKLFGPVLYEIGFGDAVDQGLLSDYKVVVLAVPEGAAARTLQKSLAEGGELKLDDAAKMIGCWRALAKVDAEEFGDDSGAPMRRAIAFCRDIRSSRLVEAAFSRAVDEYSSHSDRHGDELRKHGCEIRHVDGTFNADARKDALEWVGGDVGTGCRILTNARCLAEGVDVPALDAILFMHPRKSQIDIVQAVGRVMRKAEGKKLGYVVLPVVVPSGVSPEDALNDNERFRVVWQMLNAIRSHDERFDAMIQRIEMGEDPERLGIVAVSEDWARPRSGGSRPDRGDVKREVEAEVRQMQLEFDLPAAIQAKIVEKCGDRAYWEDWAGDVGKVAQAQIARITALVDTDSIRAAFDGFVRELRDDLNDAVSEADAIEMLAQHAVTAPVFEALFGGDGFVARNSVAKAMQKMLRAIEDENLESENQSLRSFYESVRRRVAGAKNGLAQQRIVAELYDKFFRKAFPKTTQRLGIVYTPVEVVDFILHSVQRVLEDDFGTAIGAEGVHVLDPFTGTGTFVTRLLQSGLIEPRAMDRKYRREIHANEIVLLAYYVATANIEKTYASLRDRYAPFEGICLTDTFTMQNQEDLVARLMPENSKRRGRQKELPIRVIIGNPPWSAWQASSAEGNPNVDYPELERRVAETFAARSASNLKNSLYDTYKMAFRWASDRIGEQGVVAFVTNGSWIDGNVNSGVRACLAEEFNSIWVLNLRGNAYTSGELRRAEGDNAFGQGSRAPVAITLLVRNPKAKRKGCRILYGDVGDYLSRDEKLAALSKWESIAGVSDWREIEPDRHHDWLDQRNEDFEHLYPMGTKDVKAGRGGAAVFGLFSNGYKSGRDGYVYNFSREILAESANKMVKGYQSALQMRQKRPGYRIRQSSGGDGKSVHWDDKLQRQAEKGVSAAYSPTHVRTVAYRPFVKQYLYADEVFAQRPARTREMFPESNTENRAICVPGVGSTKPFSALMVDAMPDLHFVEAGQCFPRYRFERRKAGEGDLLDEKSELMCIDNVTDSALQAFRSHYGNNEITKDAIFDYIYGVLLAPAYGVRFASNLAKELPRVPFAPDFDAFAGTGKRLGELHLGYATCPEYPLSLEYSGEGAPLEKHFRLGPKAMKFADEARSILIINEQIQLKGIPPEAHGYVVNGRTPLEWFIDRYRITKDKHSGIVNDPNAWFGNPRDLIAAIQRIVHLSVESTQSIYWLPEAISADDPAATATKAHFNARARKAAQAMANSPWEAEDQAFVDAITDWNDG